MADLADGLVGCIKAQSKNGAFAAPQHVESGGWMAQLRGDRLRASRDQLGLTQRDMAEAIGVSLSEYSRWERGRLKKIPPADKVVACCLALGVSIRYLLDMLEQPALPSFLTDDEREVLDAYRSLAADAKTSARNRLKALRDGHQIGDVVPFRRVRR